MKCRVSQSRTGFLLVVVAALTSSAIPSRAFAQAEDQAGARALFTDGKRLMKAGKYAEACPKLEAAQKLYSSAGILLNLADCYEKIGRTASAWTRFGDAVSVANRSNRPEDADEARRRQEALEPALVRLVVRVTAAVPGLVVTRDGTPLDEAIWGTTLPVDPGDHLVRAEAPGYEPWSSSVSITRRGDTVTVKVPKLTATASVERAAPERIPADQPPPKPPARASSGGGHGLALGLLIGGAAVGAGGGVLMVLESQKATDARNQTNPSAYDATRGPWAAGLVGVIAGGVAGVVGIVLLVVSPSSSDSSSADATTAWIAPGPGGIQIAGTW